MFPPGVYEVFIGCRTHPLRYKLLRKEGEISGVSPLFTLDDSRKMQRHSKTLRDLRSAMRGCDKYWSGPVCKFKRHVKELFISEGVLMHQTGKNNPCIVIDLELLVEVVLVFHYNMAHIGRNKMLDLVRGYVWHPNINMVVEDVTRSCLVCQLGKTSVMKFPPIHKMESCYPGDLVAVDLLTLPRNCEGNVGLLVAVDHYSKWVTAIPIKNKT